MVEEAILALASFLLLQVQQIWKEEVRNWVRKEDPGSLFFEA